VSSDVSSLVSSVVSSLEVVVESVGWAVVVAAVEALRAGSSPVVRRNTSSANTHMNIAVVIRKVLRHLWVVRLVVVVGDFIVLTLPPRRYLSVTGM
jgi:hypothetical protein